MNLNLPVSLVDAVVYLFNIVTACSNIGAEVAFLDTNAEYESLRDGVFGNTRTKSQQIYIQVKKSGSGPGTQYWWNDEEVDDDLWWAREPNRQGPHPANRFDSDCHGASDTCRPVVMDCYYSIDYRGPRPLLMDTCCKHELPVLCVQDVDECVDAAKNSCPENSNCVNTKWSYNCDCISGYEKKNQQCVGDDGGIATDHRTVLVHIPETLNGANYIATILQPHVALFMQNNTGYISQQDNAHRVRETQVYLTGKQIGVIHPWPAV
ncbi:transposable element tcb1 transposase [Plakobranchus ocellatus]|uniref:Transposable element tcb1 transposase n=1 Tax=Plakobranchus ocellatus TaxID=259542 RepID=A0AAV4C6C7_9GAST|nr:transposable element tcb1 transposase [Plakobranchus ocellatus]